MEVETSEVKEEIKADESPEEQFDYTKAENFTSEIYKIEISKLPKYFGYGECKKLLSKKLKLKPHKINVLKHCSKAYVTFKNENDKTQAMETLSNYKYKGKQFEVKNARPKKDAMALKRPGERKDSGDLKKVKLDEDVDVIELLKNTVIPWWNIDYGTQLKNKQGVVCEVLGEIRRQITSIKQLDLELFRWLMELKKTTGFCCPVREILPSPVVEKYRNKCGFTIGRDVNDLPTVGFRLGKYKDQVCAVESPSCLIHIPDKMKEVASSLTDYIRKSKLLVYNLFDHTGHWKQLLVRTTLKNMVLVTITICRKDLSDQEFSEEKKAVVEHFESNAVKIDTLIFETVATHIGVDSVSSSVEVGDGVIYEKLFDLTFRVSPDAFFQCNTLAAEVLYTCVENMALKCLVDKTEYSEENQLDHKNTILLDVCCGTGTIGLSLAGSVKHVIGLDSCESAIEDANKNKELNDLKNVDFHCGKAEDLLSSLIGKYQSSRDDNIVAVVDPPRCGLHPKVIKTLRHCLPIKKLVYVSCSLEQAKNNFIDLCRPQSKRMIGLPFKPVLAQPLDLFPHTKHCEVVVLFQRIEDPYVFEEKLRKEKVVTETNVSEGRSSDVHEDCSEPQESETSVSDCKKDGVDPKDDGDAANGCFWKNISDNMFHGKYK